MKPEEPDPESRVHHLFRSLRERVVDVSVLFQERVAQCLDATERAHAYVPASRVVGAGLVDAINIMVRLARGPAPPPPRAPSRSPAPAEEGPDE